MNICGFHLHNAMGNSDKPSTILKINSNNIDGLF